MVIHDIVPAGEIVRRMATEARRALETDASTFLTQLGWLVAGRTPGLDQMTPTHGFGNDVQQVVCLGFR